MPKKKDARFLDLHSNKIYLTLRYLDAAEHKRLMRYLHSPYFNQSKTLAKLCEMLLWHIERGKPGFNRELAWSKLFPGEPYDDVNFRKYCSDLLKQVEGFMAQEMLGKDEARQAIDALDFVVRRKIEILFNSGFRQVRAELEKQRYRSLDYFHKAYTVESQYYSMKEFDVKFDVRSNVEEISNNLDLFYWIEKIKLQIAVLSQKKTRGFDYGLNFMDDIVQHLRRFPIEDVPQLAIYYYVFLTLHEEENVEHYYNLRRLLDKHGAHMPQEEAIELFESALHYCTGKLNKGNRVFLEEYFDLFQNAIEKGIFIVNGEFATWRLNNIIGVALRLGKLDWAEHFIEKHKGFLPPDTRQNTYAFNLARVYRYQGKFSKVLDLLHDLEYEDIGYNLISKAMLTITYYELDEIEALDSFLESFRVFLNRNKKVQHLYRRHHLNLIKYTRRLTRLAPGDKAAVEKLREEIIREKATTVNHEWLLEKLEKLA